MNMTAQKHIEFAETLLLDANRAVEEADKTDDNQMQAVMYFVAVSVNAAQAHATLALAMDKWREE